MVEPMGVESWDQKIKAKLRYPWTKAELMLGKPMESLNSRVEPQKEELRG